MSQLSLHPSPQIKTITFRFLWISKTGPLVRHFHDANVFAGYVAEVRRICGPSVVDFRTPHLAIGVLP